MVIGNGEMGKVAALALAEAGAHVTVTVRQYRSGIVSIPKGCDRINYGERMEFFLPVTWWSVQRQVPIYPYKGADTAG